MRKNNLLILVIIIFSTFLFASNNIAQDKKRIDFEDVMKFKRIINITFSEKGNYLGFIEKIDRGNSKGIILSLSDTTEKMIIERANYITFTKDERKALIEVLQDFEFLEKAKKNEIKNDLMIVNLVTGDTTTKKQVRKYLASDNSEWLAINYYSQKDTLKKKEVKSKREVGTNLSLFDFNGEEVFSSEFISEFAFDSLSKSFVYAVSDTSGDKNGLYIIDLSEEKISSNIIDTLRNGIYTSLNWNKKGDLAFVKSVFDTTRKNYSAELYFYSDKKLVRVADSTLLKNNWLILSKNKLRWTKDGDRIFFGLRPFEKIKHKDSSKTGLYDFEKILEKNTLDVWHWDDPLIKTNEKISHKENKDKLYSAVYNLKDELFIQLEDSNIVNTTYSENSNFLLAASDNKYRKEITWDGIYNDYFLIDLRNGTKEKIIEKQKGVAILSPEGRFALYFKENNWFLLNTQTQKIHNITEKIPVNFFDEDIDVPDEPAAYGVGGWLKNDEGVFIYDKYDIWLFEAENGNGKNLTNSFGRSNELTLRIFNMDKDKEYYDRNEILPLQAFHQKEKYRAIYAMDLNNNKLDELINESINIKLISKAKQNNKILFSKESFNLYPDLYLTDTKFQKTKKLTNYQNQLNNYYWGNAELIDWLSIDGIPLQGIVIKPENYDQQKKYPVIIYYYEIFSDRLHNFQEMVVNHRPNLALYTSNDYVVFLPDVKYEIGRPGYSATKCIVPGVHKLIEMGIADPKAIGLHGHSWSGYQTAFVITQTDIFACAIAVAPVSNMTSAYSGIRLGTGLARQFQYEKQQSRIGGSLWEFPERYIENSPVFFADKIKTPLLIQHGDDDEAVPWYQGIELYLAMRRLNKDCIFLQYRGEPHHLKIYSNKLDYSIRMKEYFDHYLKKIPAAEWIKNGKAFEE